MYIYFVLPQGAQRELAQLAIVKLRRAEALKERELTGRKPGMSKQGIDDEAVGSSSDDSDDDSDDEGDKKKKIVKEKLNPAQVWMECMFWLFIVGLLSVYFIVCMLTLLLMPLVGLDFCIGLDLVTPSL
jgi:hypothetical protein